MNSTFCEDEQFGIILTGWVVNENYCNMTSYFKVKCFKWTFGDIKLTLSHMKTCNLEMIRKLAYVDNYYSDHLYNSRVKEFKN